MRRFVKYIVYQLVCLLICFSLVLNADAQHKRSGTKKSKSSSSSHKKSAGSNSRKSKGGSKKSKKSRSRHHAEAEEVDNDERVAEVPYHKTELVTDNSDLRNAFLNPPDAAKPWVYWYWLRDAVSREAITADLQSMKDAGLAGIYLRIVKNNGAPLPIIQPVVQPEQLLGFATSEAERLGLKLIQLKDTTGNDPGLPKASFGLTGVEHLTDAAAANRAGDNIIPANAFTQTQISWGEHPGLLKAAGDRAFASGINRLVLQGYTLNSWDRKPGVTLDGAGIYFQRDQTWWKPGKAWLQYLARCQAMLQVGKPVIAVAAEMPRDLVATDSTGQPAKDVLWMHRTAPDFDLYFVTNQQAVERKITFSVPVADKMPELWDAVTGETIFCQSMGKCGWSH